MKQRHAAMSESAAEEPEKPFLPRWSRYVIIPGVVGPVLIFGFIFVNQFSHDETRCPYIQGEKREVAPSVFVRDDHRNCLGNVEDHRYSVIRDGYEKEIGFRRFDAQAFEPGKYQWQAKISPQGEVSVDIHVDGHEDRSFREGTPADEGK